MSKQTKSNIKVGLFVLAGLAFLILLLYMIGRNENLFGSSFPLRAQFTNVQGLTEGNNVRYAGIQVGTVKKVKILSDTSIEVTMHIDTDMKDYIRKNAVASISTDGLMGNMVVNIVPGQAGADLVQPNDLLPVKPTVDLNDMIQSLAGTTGDIAEITTQLKYTISRINSSTALWQILDDKELPSHLRASLLNVRSATARAGMLVSDLQGVVADVKKGKGSLGALLTDTAFAVSLQQAINKIDDVAEETDSLATTLRKMSVNLKDDLENGAGPVNALLRDSVMTENLQQSIENIQAGTERFNQIMEALKHNFLLRGYFRRLERQKQKEK